YPAAIRSMMDNWHNFFFAAYDPGGFVSIDKPPVGFWLDVASAKLFGFNAVSILLPSALAGVLSVLLLYHLVRRHFGVVAGLLSAPKSIWNRMAHLVVAGLLLLVISLSWAVAVDLTPASQRPYVGSTQNNSEISLAFGYNGIQRLLGGFGGGSGGNPPNGRPP